MRPIRSVTINNCGWKQSKAKKQCIDGNGKPIPWYTYSSIFYLEPKVSSSMIVFEFGSGYSTLWWAKRVERVIAVEHNLEWFNLMTPKLPNNATIIFKEQGDNYFNYIDTLDIKFDIIAIDGYAGGRYKSTLPALRNITDAGVFVLDNADADYAKANYDDLISAGYIAIDFTGMGAINNSFWCTSIFYKPNNNIFNM